MEEMALLLGRDSAVRIPKVYRELCTRRLLVQERFEGFTVADTERLDAAGIDRNALAEQLLRSTLDQVLRRRVLPRRSAPGQHLRVRATAPSASSTSARSAGSTRSSRPRSSTSSPRSCGATSASCATASSGSPT